MIEKQDKTITPKTRVGELLEHYPELERVLFDLSPAFKKLKNPVLRKTVAKVATLQQAASIGNLTVTELVNTLRSEVGQKLYDAASTGDKVNFSEPAWFDPDKVTHSFDATPIIDGGQNPMQEVFTHLDNLEPDKIFMLSTPFVPAPIIELIGKKGYAHYCQKSEEGGHHTYFMFESSP